MKTFAFSLLLGFLCCSSSCHAHSTYPAICSCRRNFSLPTFRVARERAASLRSLIVQRRKLWLFVAKLNATRCAVSLSTGGESVLLLGGVNCKTNKRMRSSCIKCCTEGKLKKAERIKRDKVDEVYKLNSSEKYKETLRYISLLHFI